MKTYSVELVRRVISRATISVDADCVEDAEKEALTNCSYIDDFTDDEDVVEVTHTSTLD